MQNEDRKIEITRRDGCVAKAMPSLIVTQLPAPYLSSILLPLPPLSIMSESSYPFTSATLNLPPCRRYPSGQNRSSLPLLPSSLNLLESFSRDADMLERQLLSIASACFSL